LATADLEKTVTPKFRERIADRYRKDKYAFWLAALVLAFLIINTTRSAFLGVHVDEANWFMQTRHLQAGYFFHPPFIVYQLYATTALFGDNALGLRIGSILFTAGTLVMIYLLSLDIFRNKGNAFLATLMVSVMPFTNYSLTLGFQDAPFIFFTVTMAFLLWRALYGDEAKYWYAAGLAAGLMLLCNLRSVPILLGVLIFLLASGKGRSWLRRKEPYLAVSLMVLLFLPTLIWYVSHHFEPITYQLTKRPGFLVDGPLAYLEDVARHIIWEASTLSPTLWFISIFGLAFAGFASIRQKDNRYGYLFCLAAPAIVLFAITSGPPNWALPAHMFSLISGASVLSFILAGSSSKRWKRWGQAFIAVSLLIALGYTTAYCYYEATSSAMHNGWQELAAEVDGVRMSMDGDGQPYLAAPAYFIPSEVAWYGDGRWAGYTVAFQVYDNKVIGDNSHYSPWVPLEDLVGKDIVFVDEKLNPDEYDTPPSYWAEKLGPYFDRVDEPVVFNETRNGQDYRTFYIYKCYGFKGPDPQMDVKGDVQEYIRETS
jgi:MFS family permease